MTSLDLIIVVVYLISVAYVLYQAWQYLWNNVEEVATVQFERGALDQQLEEKELKGVVDVVVLVDGRYKFDQPQDLTVMINNQSANYAIEVDWDRSSLTDVGGRSRRLIRLTPDRRINLYEPQVFSIIAPGKSLKERVTAEDLLKHNAEKNTMEPGAPIFTVSPSNADFMNSKKALTVSLRLALRLLNLLDDYREPRYVSLPCDISMRRIPKSDLLPWKR